MPESPKIQFPEVPEPGYTKRESYKGRITSGCLSISISSSRNDFSTNFWIPHIETSNFFAMFSFFLSIYLFPEVSQSPIFQIFARFPMYRLKEGQKIIKAHIINPRLIYLLNSGIVSLIHDPCSSIITAAYRNTVTL